MAVISRHTPWVRQPPHGVGLSASIPRPSIIFRGDVPGDRSSTRATQLVNASVAAGIGGIGTKLNSGGYVELTNDSQPFLSSTGGSALVVMSRVGAEVGSTSFAVATSFQPDARFSAHMPWSDGTLYFDFGGTNSGVTRLAIPSAVPTGTLLAFVCTGGQAGLRVWRNGQPLGSTSQAVTRTNAAASALGIGIDPSFEESSSLPDLGATYYLQAFWPSQLSDPIARSLSANPWQLFGPVTRRIYLPSAAGIPTLSAASVIDILATSARPRVTVTY